MLWLVYLRHALTFIHRIKVNAPRYAGSDSGLMKTGDWNLPFVGSIGLLLFGAIFAYEIKRAASLCRDELTSSNWIYLRSAR